MIDEVAEFKVLTDRGVPIVPVAVDGKSSDFIVDTGAHASFIEPTAAAALGLKIDRSQKPALVAGMNGTFLAYRTRAERLDLGGAMARNVTLLLAGADATRAEIPAAGLFGADFLRNYDVEFDLPSHRISLYSEEACSADFPQPWDGFAYSRFFLGFSRYPLISVRLDGHVIPIILDSGSDVSIVSSATAKAVGVTPGALATDPSTHAVAADRTIGAMRMHRFRDLLIGPEAIVAPSLAVGGALPVNLLGEDFLRHHRVWISYPHQLLWVQPVGTLHLIRIVENHP